MQVRQSSLSLEASYTLSPSLTRWLQIAAVYNILWGLWVGLAPQHFFRVLDMPEINHPVVWQGMGMVIGVYGLGYWWAARDYVRHWPIVAVGMLGKLFGPLGYVGSLVLGTLPYPQFGWTLLTNDLLWWVPFGLILREAWRVHRFSI
jgi:hypothetical protein